MSWQIGSTILGFGLAIISWVGAMMGVPLPRWVLVLFFGVGTLLIFMWPVTYLATQFVRDPQKRLPVMIGIGGLLVVLELISASYVMTGRDPALPEVEMSWGPTDDELSRGETGVTILNGQLYSQYTATHKFMAMALQWSRERDLLDSPGLQKSEKFHIRGGPIRIPIPLDKSFFNELAQGSGGTNYTVLLVPNDMNAQDFVTIRAAINGGAIHLASKSGPP
ncbi:MAG TPA: hypothetical protein VLA67_06090 [Nitrospiraceae bacterium]|nr:hypothetical protein [Nitrospiraceae bacterium]